MFKILFLIHDLGQGGAEKVLVNLVNHMDRSKFDISVTVLFGGGVNEQFLASDIHFRAVFTKEVPGNSKLMKLLTPKQLHKLCVKKHYDMEVSYLEGPSARIVSGCQNPNTKLVSWIHSSNIPWTSWPVLFAMKQKPGSAIIDLSRRFVFHSMFAMTSVSFWISKCPVRCCITQ